MKKLLSIVLSLVMLLSVGAATVNAFAIVGSNESTTKAITPRGEVNGQTSTEVNYTPDPSDPRKLTFTYVGDGELIGWEFPGMVEGTDYTVVSREGNSIVITVSPAYGGEVVANAIVREATQEVTETTTKKKKASTTKVGETTVKDKKPTSPKTGAASGLGIAAMGAGAAILTALKKKEDAE